MERYKHKMTHVRYQRQINLWITQHYMLGHPQENVDGTDGTAGTVLFVLHGTALHCTALHCTALHLQEVMTTSYCEKNAPLFFWLG